LIAAHKGEAYSVKLAGVVTERYIITCIKASPITVKNTDTAYMNFGLHMEVWLWATLNFTTRWM